jgi:hypothetical protein
VLRLGVTLGLALLLASFVEFMYTLIALSPPTVAFSYFRAKPLANLKASVFEIWSGAFL